MTTRSVPDEQFDVLGIRCGKEYPGRAMSLLGDYVKITGQRLCAEREVLFATALLSPEQGDVLEIGSYKGNSLALLSIACEVRGDSRVLSIDCNLRNNPSPLNNTWFETEWPCVGMRYTLRELGVAHLTMLLSADSKDAWRYIRGQYRLIHIDGNHSLPYVVNDIERYTPMLVPGGWLAVHDYEQAPLDVTRGCVEMMRPDDWDSIYRIENTLFARRRGSHEDCDD
jgi:hypothetical protein